MKLLKVKISMRHVACGMVMLLAGAVALPSLARKKKVVTSSPQVVAESKLSANDSKRYDYFFLEAIRQQNAGHFNEAFDLLEHARGINPDAAEVYYYQSLYYSQMKKDSLALACLEKATALAPGNQTYPERMAQYYIQNQQYGKAIESYEWLYAHNHDNTDALRILLQLYQQQKDYSKMLSTVDRLVKEEGESEQFSLSKMRIYEMMGDKKAAYTQLKSLCDSHPLDMTYKTMLGNWLMQANRTKEAYKLFTDVLKEEPDNAYAESSLYDYYNATNQKEQARQMLDRILLGKNTEVETKLVMIRSFIQENEANGGDSTQVLSLFDKALAVPHPAGEIAELRAAYMSLKKMPEDTVNAAFRKVLDIAPDNVSSRLQLIQNLWEAKKYDDVIAQTDQAQQYNPEEMVFYYFGGMAHYQKGDDDATLETFKKGLAQVNAQSSVDLVSDLYMIMADIYYKKGLEKESFAAYDSCLQWKDDNVPGLNNYAYYLSTKGKDLHKAEQMSYKTIKAEPKNATYLDTYAWILFMEERYSEAKIYIDQTLQNLDSTENNSTLYEHAGDIYAMNGLTDEAVGFWQKSYDIGNQTETVELKLKNKKYITEEEIKKMLGKATLPNTKLKVIKKRNGKKK